MSCMNGPETTCPHRTAHIRCCHLSDLRQTILLTESSKHPKGVHTNILVSELEKDSFSTKMPMTRVKSINIGKKTFPTDSA